jgi:hypothetical protein
MQKRQHRRDAATQPTHPRTVLIKKVGDSLTGDTRTRGFVRALSLDTASSPEPVDDLQSDRCSQGDVPWGQAAE